jgi:hypothetical protein
MCSSTTPATCGSPASGSHPSSRTSVRRHIGEGAGNDVRRRGRLNRPAHESLDRYPQRSLFFGRHLVPSTFRLLPPTRWNGSTATLPANRRRLTASPRSPLSAIIMRLLGKTVDELTRLPWGSRPIFGGAWRNGRLTATSTRSRFDLVSRPGAKRTRHPCDHRQIRVSPVMDGGTP